MLLGAHISIGGGISTAPEKAKKLTCNCMQIFSKNQMQWKAKPADLAEAESYRTNMKDFGIEETVVHDSYLINLASPKKSLLKMSREAFLDEMVRARHLGVSKLVFHPGSHMGAGEQLGLRRVAESLDWCREAFGGPGVLQVIEITAGQGNVLGRSFEQIAKIIDLVADKKGVGVCLDTCHMYATGYDIQTPEGYGSAMDGFDDIIGLEKLSAIHLNDSKGKLGSNKDRHEQIGKGFIGIQGFRNFVNDRNLERVPMMLETPAGDKKYKAELRLLRSLIKRQ